MTAVTVVPWPFWHPQAEQHRATSEAVDLLIGPWVYGGQRGVEFTLSPGRRPHTTDPGVLRAFAAAFASWADSLETELSKTPVGQGTLL